MSNAAPAWLKSFKTGPKGTRSKRSHSPTVLSEQNSTKANHPDTEDLGYMDDALCSHDSSLQPSHHHVAKRPAIPAKTQPLSKIMSDALQEGLEKPIDQSNIGFRMVKYRDEDWIILSNDTLMQLAKMGFREGAGLGREGSGMSNPIEVNISKGRSGLGIEEQKRREVREMMEEQKRTANTLKESFINRQKQSFEVQQVARELQKAQKACEQLDLAVGITESALWTSTDPSIVKKDSDNDLQGQREFRDASGTAYVKNSADTCQSTFTEDLSSMTENFCSIVHYLKERHHYCHYCSSRFASGAELEAYCRTDEDCAALFDLD